MERNARLKRAERSAAVDGSRDMGWWWGSKLISFINQPAYVQWDIKQCELLKLHYVVNVLAEEADILSLSTRSDFTRVSMFIFSFLKIVVLLLPSVSLLQRLGSECCFGATYSTRPSFCFVVSHFACMWTSSRHSLILSPPFCCFVQAFKGKIRFASPRGPPVILTQFSWM